MKNIKILGTGCARCEKLYQNAEAAARALGIDYQITKVTDIAEIVKMGVVFTPALWVDGKVRVSGGVPSEEEIRKILA